MGGRERLLHSVYSQSAYTKAQLTTALSTLMHVYQPAEIRTQSSYPSSQYPDHSDHVTTGRFATAAYDEYEQRQYEGAVTIPLHYYIGYPVHGMPANVSGTELDDKTRTFLAYAQYDPGVCHTVEECNATPTYGAYLARQYQNPN